VLALRSKYGVPEDPTDAPATRHERLKRRLKVRRTERSEARSSSYCWSVPSESWRDLEDENSNASAGLERKNDVSMKQQEIQGAACGLL